MDVHFHPLDSWQGACNKFKSQLPEEIKNLIYEYEVRLYPTAAFAVQDCFQGLRSLFSFKKDFGFFKGQDPFIDQSAKSMAAQGLVPKAFKTEKPTDELKAEIAEALGRETCFLSYAYCDPLLLKENDSSFLADLDDSIPIIRVDYAAKLDHLKTIGAKTAHIIGLPGGMAACILGQRVRFQSQFAPSLDGSKFEVPQWKIQKPSENSLDAFIESMKPEFQPLFQPMNSGRLALFSKDVDAEALLSLLSQDTDLLGLSTTSLSYWGGLHTLDWMKGLGFTEDQLQGTILVDQGLISDKLSSDLKKAHARILELQNGDN